LIQAGSVERWKMDVQKFVKEEKPTHVLASLESPKNIYSA